jgi:hypothetical protein
MPSSHSLKAAFSLAVLLGGLAVGGTADAQSGLPACPSDQSVRWHNCHGEARVPGNGIYAGNWADNKPHGVGSTIWPDGRKHGGEYANGLIDGFGTFNFPDRSVYIGNFKDNRANGKGVFSFPNGKKFMGDFKDDKADGQGTTIFPDGKKYVGAVKNNKANGLGTLSFKDGRKYIGAFKDDRFFGDGTYFFPDGTKYVGSFKNDKFEGQGTLNSVDGSSYIGNFLNGERSGQGIQYSANGQIIRSGIWADDKFIRSATINSVPPKNSVPREPEQGSPSVGTAPPPAAPKSSSGSAFRIGTGQFVTNHHVVDGCTTLKVSGNSGARVVASDPTRDLALVSIANDSGPIASIRTTRIQLNESITAAGFPLDGAFTGIAITNGSISRLSGLRGDTGEVQISAPVQPGNSGGPLLDVAGNVIGVVSSKLNALKLAVVSGDIPQNVNFAINGAALRAFLNAKSVNYQEVSNARELTGVQIAAHASTFTVLIECQKQEKAGTPPAGSAAPPNQTQQRESVSRQRIFDVQLAAAGTEQDGRHMMARIRLKFSREIGKRDIVIKKGVWADGTHIWRIRVVKLTKQDANSLCMNIKDKGGGCFIALN